MKLLLVAALLAFVLANLWCTGDANLQSNIKFYGNLIRIRANNMVLYNKNLETLNVDISKWKQQRDKSKQTMVDKEKELKKVHEDTNSIDRELSTLGTKLSELKSSVGHAKEANEETKGELKGERGKTLARKTKLEEKLYLETQLSGEEEKVKNLKKKKAETDKRLEALRLDVGELQRISGLLEANTTLEEKIPQEKMKIANLLGNQETGTLSILRESYEVLTMKLTREQRKQENFVMPRCDFKKSGGE